jgi:hypothetical protein
VTILQLKQFLLLEETKLENISSKEELQMEKEFKQTLEQRTTLVFYQMQTEKMQLIN